MNKKVVVTLAVLSLGTSVGFASPINDFTAGKVAIDISAKSGDDIKVSDGSGSATYDGKTSWNYGATVGLGNNFALQYTNLNPKSKDYKYYGYTFNGELKTQEINVLYKLDKNVTVFTGINQVKSTFSLSGYSFTGDTKSNWQVGVTGQTPIGDKLTGYATIAVGEDTNSWKIGTAYAIDQNLDFNLFYSENSYNKVKYNKDLASLMETSEADYKVKGIGYGVTYKF